MDLPLDVLGVVSDSEVKQVIVLRVRVRRRLSYAFVKRVNHIDLEDDRQHRISTGDPHLLDHSGAHVVVILVEVPNRDTQYYILLDLLLDGLGDPEAKPRIDFKPLLEDIFDVFLGDHFD